MVKTDLRVGCLPATIAPTSPGFQGIREWLLDERGEAKSAIDAWSHGTDHPKIMKKLTFEFVTTQVQSHQIPEVSQGIRDGSCVDRGPLKWLVSWD